MELPNVGSQCGNGNCNMLDFLPVVCKYCTKTFCTYHYQPNDHNCSSAPDVKVSKVCLKF